MSVISWADFEKIDIRSGTIIEVKDFPKARKPSYQIWIDFGAELGIKKSSAQVTDHYKKEVLLNRQVIAVVNFPPKQIADFFSECLVLGVYDENNHVILLQPERAVKNGQRIG
jgi:tRNA-binding protein